MTRFLWSQSLWHTSNDTRGICPTDGLHRYAQATSHCKSRPPVRLVNSSRMDIILYMWALKAQGKTSKADDKLSLTLQAPISCKIEPRLYPPLFGPRHCDGQSSSCVLLKSSVRNRISRKVTKNSISLKASVPVWMLSSLSRPCGAAVRSCSPAQEAADQTRSGGQKGPLSYLGPGGLLQQMTCCV